jgi:outer membrane protein assembly factor BamB
MTGKPVWSHSYPAELGDRYFEGGPTSTPTIDGDRVYTLSRWGDLFCFDLTTGKVRWSKNVQQETEAPIPSWGFASSPLVHEDLLVLNVGEAGLAVDKTSGKIAWSSGRSESGYSTPLPFQHQGRWYAWLGTSNAYVAVDIKTGKVLWEHRWITRYGVNATDPLPSGEHVFISTGYGKGATLLQIGEGEPKSLWRTKEMCNQINSSVLIDGFVYGMDGDTTEDAVLKCVEMKTGKTQWVREGVGTGALMAAEGKLIVLSASGELLIGKASPKEFTPTTRAQVLEGKCWTVPVLAGGRIYCRNADGDVVCLDVREKK